MNLIRRLTAFWEKMNWNEDCRTEKRERKDLHGLVGRFELRE